MATPRSVMEAKVVTDCEFSARFHRSLAPIMSRRLLERAEPLRRMPEVEITGILIESSDGRSLWDTLQGFKDALRRSDQKSLQAMASCLTTPSKKLLAKYKR